LHWPSTSEMADSVEQRVRAVAERVASSLGLELWDVEFRGAGKARMLRIYIDKPGGVTHENCADVSREVGTILDVEDVVPGASYTLEVSSPGMDRKLRNVSDYERFAGSKVRLMTREAVNGRRDFEGRLQGVHDGRVTLELAASKKKKQAAATAPGPVEIDLANVEKAQLVPEF
jgi:ribosome maturation factor RimP